MYATLHAVVRLLILSLWLRRAGAQNGPTSWTTSPFNPPALPLTVRSPYFNIWLAQGNGPYPLNLAWPQSWDSASVFGWYASVVVDGTSYKVMAATNQPPITMADQSAIEFTATRTSFIFPTGPMQINMSFISPIEPANLVRQSLPFSYLTMSATSIDGNSHDVRMFASINGEIITGDSSMLAQWASEDDDDHIMLTMELQEPQMYSEIANHAQDGTAFFGFKKMNGTTASWSITNNVGNHALAANINETLGNQADSNFRAVNDDWPTLGIAVDWDSITETPDPAVWAIGLVRSPTVQYRTPGGSVQDRYPYFLSTYRNGSAAARAFLDDFSRAQSAAQVFDAQLVAASQVYSSEYAELVSLTVRQVMGSMDITIGRSDGGDWNLTDVKVFMKNMGGLGSDATGSTLSVNTVDTLYVAFPVFLYLNPELFGYLLSPLLEYQDSSAYTLNYAARNIGSAYPNATADGINYAHAFGVEESANMLIMTLAYSQRSGNGTFLSRHYTLLRGWAEYLEDNALTPSNQTSTDFASDLISSNNQTNLALKGIIGIACMGKIAEIAGSKGDQERFDSTSSSYISQWTRNALASDSSHVNFYYGKSNTSGLIYNLYSDKLLQLNLVSSSVYDVVAAFYNNMTGTSTYGIPMDNLESQKTTSYAMMFAASTLTNMETRNYMVSQVHGYAASSQNSTPFAAAYYPSTGQVLSGSNAGQNSPTAGAIFSLLAINTSIESSIYLPSDGSTISDEGYQSKAKASVGAITGGIIGAVLGLAIVLFAVFCYRRRQRRLRTEYENTKVVPLRSPTSATEYSESFMDPRRMPQSAVDSVYTSSEKPWEESAERSPQGRAGLFVARGLGRVPESPTRTRTTDDVSGTRVGSLSAQVQLSAELATLRMEIELLRREGHSMPSDSPPSYTGFTIS